MTQKSNTICKGNIEKDMQPYQIRIVLTHNTTKSHKGAKVFIKGLTPISTNKLEKNTARPKKNYWDLYQSNLCLWLKTLKQSIG